MPRREMDTCLARSHGYLQQLRRGQEREYVGGCHGGTGMYFVPSRQGIGRGGAEFNHVPQLCAGELCPDAGHDSVHALWSRDIFGDNGG